jgi:hypothetical protein
VRRITRLAVGGFLGVCLGLLALGALPSMVGRYCSTKSSCPSTTATTTTAGGSAAQ